MLAVRPEGLRAKGDRDLAAILLADGFIQRFIEKRERDEVAETRRYLLSTAVRLTASMAPELHHTAEHCHRVLGVDEPLELYVAPSPHYNAFSYGSERGRVFVGLTSALLEAFAAAELRFVIGHELGHYIFRHHEIPVAALVHRRSGIRAEQAIQLFSWQRYAEISADRAGLVCAGALTPTARAFFKLASGLRGDNIVFDIDEYLGQIGDIESEAAQARQGKERPRSDWFASHPFSPLRVRAAQLCTASEVCGPEGVPIAQLESEVEQLMSLMDPSYLLDKSDTGEAMRRLLFAGGVLVTAASGPIRDEEVAALERFLGEGSLPAELSPEALQADLDDRIEFAKQHVPPLKRAQVIRDLCVIALADEHADEQELTVIRGIAERLDVDPTVVDQTLVAARSGLD
jgi:Zn-dependent protease with chaperone function